MSIKTEGYSRKPFHVDAVQITAENMKEVAAWCAGEIRTGTKVIRNDDNKIVDRKEVLFVKVGVHRPLNERQTKGYVGDWVLLSDSGFKVYTGHAFEKAFGPESSDFEEDLEEDLDQLSLDFPEVILTLKGAQV